MLLQIVCLISVLLNVAHAATDQITRQAFLDCHNFMRAQLALGKYAKQPPAADMTVMDYDSLLEERAIAWNDQCKPGHDTSDHRLVQSYKATFSAIGQNWAGITSGSLSKFSCEGWWNEYVDYDYATNSKKDPSKMIGHYTQMAWAKSTMVGCAVTNTCTQAYVQHSVCNYAAAGNYNGEKPYKQGTACTQCPDGYTRCMNGALCARPDQCSKSSASCTCALTCQNGGVLDSSACSCKCADGFFGDNCQNKCEDTNQYCAPGYIIDCANSYWSNNCKKRCNNCVNTKPFVTQAHEGVRIQIRADWLNPNAASSNSQITQKPGSIQNSTGSGSFPTTQKPTQTNAPGNGECYDYQEKWCNDSKSQCNRCPVVDTLCPLTCKTCSRALQCRDNSNQCKDAKKYNCQFFYKQLCRESCSDCANKLNQNQSPSPVQNAAAVAVATTVKPAPPADCLDWDKAYCSARSQTCWCPVIKSLCADTCNTCEFRRICADRSLQGCDATKCGGAWKFLCRKTCNLC